MGCHSDVSYCWCPGMGLNLPWGRHRLAVIKGYMETSLVDSHRISVGFERTRVWNILRFCLEPWAPSGIWRTGALYLNAVLEWHDVSFSAIFFFSLTDARRARGWWHATCRWDSCYLPLQVMLVNGCNSHGIPWVVSLKTAGDILY